MILSAPNRCSRESLSQKLLKMKKLLRIDVGDKIKFDAQIDLDNEQIKIDEIIDSFNKAKQAGATHVSWYDQTDFYDQSSSCDAIPFKLVEESDEEFQKRLKIEEAKTNNYRILHESKERAEYERLKTKFKNK